MAAVYLDPSVSISQRVDDLFTRPVRQLAGVHRVSPEVGESCRVEFEFDTSQLAFLDKGLTSVTLEVLPESSAAIALYRSVGFTESRSVGADAEEILMSAPVNGGAENYHIRVSGV